MSKFWIELYKEWGGVFLGHKYTTNPQVFPYTWRRVLAINLERSDDPNKLVQAFESITNRAKTIDLIIDDELGELKVTIKPQSIRLRLMEWLSGLPSIKDWRYRLVEYPEAAYINQSVRQGGGMTTTPDGKIIIAWHRRMPTTQALKNAFPH